MEKQDAEDSADESASRHQIAELTEAFCRSIDRCDEASLAAMFHRDGMVSNGVFMGSGSQFAAEICRTVRAVFNRTFHTITSQRLDIRGEQATGETHIVIVGAMTRDDGAPAEIVSHGVYIDRFERRSGVWKFLERRFLCDWAFEGSPADAENVDRSNRAGRSPVGASRLLH